ncbi:MAG: hypothetical protein Q7R95_05510 [bacterium]|nr:hypothetical protein [bacterium]
MSNYKSEYSPSFMLSLPPMLQYLMNWENRNDQKFFNAYDNLKYFEFDNYITSILRWLLPYIDVSANDLRASVAGPKKLHLMNAIALAYNQIASDIENCSVADILSKLESKGFPQMYLFHGTAYTARVVTSGFREIYPNPLTQEKVFATQWFGQSIIRHSPFLPLQQFPYIIAFPMTEIVETMETYPYLGKPKIENLESISLPTFTFDFLHAPQNAMINILSKTKVFAHPHS